MKKNKAFTLIETIIALAVTAIVIGMIASLSVVANKLVDSEKYSAKCIAEFQSVKNKMETFFSDYSSSTYSLKLSDLSENEMLVIKNGEDSVAKVEIAENKLSFFKENEGDLVESDNFEFANIISIEINSEINLDLISCTVKFDEFHDTTFLINIGGMALL